jgi:ABC-type nitrate/sulfonate/bicarbonate transport system substrate-binding protein
MSTVALGAVALIAGSTGSAVASSAHHQTTTPAVPAGHWYPMTAAGSAGPLSVPPPDPSGCPNGITTGGAYGCIEGVTDGSGHKVIIRYGQTGGFGFLHFLNDHNLDLGPVEVTIGNNQNGILQSNGNYHYGEYYGDPSGTEVSQYVLVFEDRGAAGNGDGFELGVVTAFCQGPGHSFEQNCPDWVNETL